MTQLQQSITIERPLEAVWDYVLDARNDPVWQAFVVEVGRGADQPAAVGLEVEAVVRFLGRTVPIVLTYTEHEPRRRSAIEVSGPVQGRGSYELEPVDGGARFTFTIESDSHRFFRVAEPLFARAGKRVVGASLGTLKDDLEAS
jgi:hypothetical protein